MTRYEQERPGLTPAASTALDQLVVELKAELLKIAENNAASPFGTAEEISVNDIRSAFYEIVGQRRNLRSRGDIRSRRLLLSYVVGGVATMVLSLSYLVSSSTAGLPVRQIVAAAIGVSAALIALGSVVILDRLSTRKRILELATSGSVEPSNDAATSGAAVIFAAWLKVELALRDSIATEFGESIASEPLSSLVRRAELSGVLGVADAEDLRNLLKLRNSVAHKRREVDEKDVATAKQTAEDLVAKMTDISVATSRRR